MHRNFVAFAGLAICIASVACAATDPGATVARAVDTSTVNAQKPVVIFADNPDDTGAYAMVVIAGSADALAGQLLQAFAADASRPPQAVTVETRIAADDDSGCTATERVQLAPTDDLLPESGALLSSIDVNPGGHYSAHRASLAERAQVLTALFDGLTDVPVVLRGASVADDAVDMRIVRVADRPVMDVAVVSIDLRVASTADASPDDGTTIRWFALVERRADSGWRRSLLERGQGCDDCDALPAHARLRAFGDLDQDGQLDLLLEQTGYESTSWRVLDYKNDRWTSGPSFGQTGC